MTLHILFYFYFFTLYNFLASKEKNSLVWTPSMHKGLRASRQTSMCSGDYQALKNILLFHSEPDPMKNGMENLLLAPIYEGVGSGPVLLAWHRDDQNIVQRICSVFIALPAENPTKNPGWN